MEATQGHHGKCIELLIGAGADVNIQDNNGDTSLMKALHGKCVEQLIEQLQKTNSSNQSYAYIYIKMYGTVFFKQELM